MSVSERRKLRLGFWRGLALIAALVIGTLVLGRLVQGQADPGIRVGAFISSTIGVFHFARFAWQYDGLGSVRPVCLGVAPIFWLVAIRQSLRGSSSELLVVVSAVLLISGVTACVYILASYEPSSL